MRQNHKSASICVLDRCPYPRSGYGPVDFIDLWFFYPFFCRGNISFTEPQRRAEPLGRSLRSRKMGAFLSKWDFWGKMGSLGGEKSSDKQSDGKKVSKSGD